MRMRLGNLVEYAGSALSAPHRPSASPRPGPLEPMQPFERLEADYRGTGLTVGNHPMHYLRGQMTAMCLLASREVETAG